MCDRARNGHWVSTQGNQSNHSLSHLNALQPGYAISSKSKKYVTLAAKPPNASGRKAAATSSSTGSTIAEADLLIAKENRLSIPMDR